VRRIKTAVGNPRTGCELLYENRTIPGTPLEHRRKRSDLVIKKGNRIHVVDVTIPFENGEDAFKEAKQRKKEKYENTKALLRKGRIQSYTVDACINVCPTASNGQGTFFRTTSGMGESLGPQRHHNSHNKLTKWDRALSFFVNNNLLSVNWLSLKNFFF